MKCEWHACSDQGRPHLRAADIDVGKTSLVTGDGQVGDLLALVIDAEMEQFIDVETGLFEFLVLEGPVEVVTKHGLEAVESRDSGSPQAMSL